MAPSLMLDTIQQTHPHLARDGGFPKPSSWTDSNDSNNSTSTSILSCIVNDGQIIISRNVFVALITLCALITFVSAAIITVLVYREYIRRQQSRAAKDWGRQSRVRSRMSEIRKEMDAELIRKQQRYQEYSNEDRTSELEGKGGSPTELMLSEPVWEVPGRPAVPDGKADGRDGADRQQEKAGKRKSRAVSVFFDQALGLWTRK